LVVIIVLKNKNMITSSEKNQKYELFIVGYLTASRIICDKILDNKKPGNITEGEWGKEAFVPAIYNLKHALELIEKLFISLIGLFDLDTINHNIDKLFIDSKSEIKLKIEEAYETVKIKVREESSVENKIFYKIAKSLISEKGKGVDFFVKELDKLEVIVNKYYQPNFVNINHEKEVGEDEGNLFFRYPFHKNGNSYNVDYLDINNNFQHLQKVIKEIKADTNDLRGIMQKILLMIDYVERQDK